MSVKAVSYTSPTLVLLAYDWPIGDQRKDFLGFAIERSPGYDGQKSSWLPNRIDFHGPAPEGKDYSSDKAPIQKFYWWDARIDTKDRGTTFNYRIVPVTGTSASLKLNDGEAASIDVQVPQVEENGITSHFNRAVLSSQAFTAKFPKLNTPALLKAGLAWLANGMEQAIPDFFARAGAKDVEGAIYHLTDTNWILPAMRHYGGPISLAFNRTKKDTTSDKAISSMVAAGRPRKNFRPRTKANIMHNKFLVRVGHGDHAEAVLAGSANFTPEALGAQANVLHAFESPDLAALYLARKRLLDKDPSLADTAKAERGWSKPMQVGDALVRVFFEPESKTSRETLDTMIGSIKTAKNSVFLCAFDPTDAGLLDAVFGAADKGLMMYALVNRVPAKKPAGDPKRSDVAAAISILDRAQKDHDMAGFAAFKAGETPTGFQPEKVLLPKENPKIMVRVHHKFVIIDPEGDNPIVYTGSANFSNNSTHQNDENLLEIRNCPRMARMYLAEFMRLFEHYRARDAFKNSGKSGTFKLMPDDSWAKKYFVKGSAEMKARISLSTAVPLPGHGRGSAR